MVCATAEQALSSSAEMNGQAYYFLICILCGVSSGVLYDVFYLVKRFLTGEKTGLLLDVLFFLLFAGMYIFLSVLLGFPDFRLYLFLGCLIGLVLYLKSVHIILDFLVNMLYNKIEKK